MTEGIIIGILSLCGTLLGSIAGIMTANKLTAYRIEQLERKVDKHNQIVEQFAVMKRDEEAQWDRIDELRSQMEKIKKEVWSHESV